MDSKFSASSKGITLVELIISLALLSIVLTAVFSMLSFGNKVYGKGTSEYDVQSDIRLATDYITQQLRYAAEVEILSGKDDTDADAYMKSNLSAAISDPNNIPAYVNYIYYDVDSNGNGCIKQLSRFTERTFQLGKNGDLTFSKDTANNTLLNFSITGHNNDQTYNVDSEITCLNLHLSQIPTNSVQHLIVGLSSGKAIYYKTISDYISETQRPVISLDTGTGKLDNKNTLDLVFDRDISTDTGSVLITNQGTTQVNKYATITRTGIRTVEISIGSGGASDGRTVEFQVTFADADNSTWKYIVSYDKNFNWTIQ